MTAAHIAGLLMLILLVPVASALAPLVLGAVTTLILVIVAAWEWISLRRKPISEVPEILSC